MSDAVTERSMVKGLLAGLIGGLAGTAAKTVVERIFPPQTPKNRFPWGVGAAAGAAYGAVAEFYPAATAKEGASFGLVLEALTHEGALPVLGLSAEPQEQTMRERTSELSSHVVYGVVTEMVRGLVRGLL